MADHPIAALMLDEPHDPKDTAKIAILFADLPPLPTLHVRE